MTLCIEHLDAPFLLFVSYPSALAWIISFCCLCATRGYTPLTHNVLVAATFWISLVLVSSWQVFLAKVRRDVFRYATRGVGLVYVTCSLAVSIFAILDAVHSDAASYDRAEAAISWYWSLLHISPLAGIVVSCWRKAAVQGGRFEEIVSQYIVDVRAGREYAARHDNPVIDTLRRCYAALLEDRHCEGVKGIPSVHPSVLSERNNRLDWRRRHRRDSTDLNDLNVLNPSTVSHPAWNMNSTRTLEVYETMYPAGHARHHPYDRDVVRHSDRINPGRLHALDDRFDDPSWYGSRRQPPRPNSQHHPDTISNTTHISSHGGSSTSPSMTEVAPPQFSSSQLVNNTALPPAAKKRLFSTEPLLENISEMSRGVLVREPRRPSPPSVISTSTLDMSRDPPSIPEPFESSYATYESTTYQREDISDAIASLISPYHYENLVYGDYTASIYSTSEGRLPISGQPILRRDSLSRFTQQPLSLQPPDLSGDVSPRISPTDLPRCLPLPVAFSPSSSSSGGIQDERTAERSLVDENIVLNAAYMAKTRRRPRPSAVRLAEAEGSITCNSHVTDDSVTQLATTYATAETSCMDSTLNESAVLSIVDSQWSSTADV